MLPRLTASLCFLAALPLASFAEETEDASTVPDSPAKEADREGFERGIWRAEDFGSVNQARNVVLPGHKDNTLLCVHYQAGKAGKAALKRYVGMAAAEDGKLRLSVYSGDMHPPRVAMALSTTEKFNWQETEPVKLKSGWNNLSFNLNEKKWKSAATEWKNTAALAERTDVRGIVLIVYNGSADGVLYVDGVKLDRDDQTTGIEALMKRLAADEFGEREDAEKGLIAKGSPALESLNELIETTKDQEVLTRAKRIVAKITGRDAGDKTANHRE